MKKIFSFLCILLFSSYIAQAQITLLGSENFDSGPNHGFTFSPSNGALQDHDFAYSGNTSLWIHVPLSIGDSVVVTSPMYDCSSMANLLLRFKHICKVAPTDVVRLEYLIDGVGNKWTPIPANTYLGQAQNYSTYGFNDASYKQWKNNDNVVLPNDNWWVEESFDLTNVASYAKISFRFIIKKGKDISTSICYGWLIDNFELFGSIDNSADTTKETVALAPPCLYFTSYSLIDAEIYQRGPFKITAKIATRTKSPINSPVLVYTASHPNVGTITDSLPMQAYEGDSLWEATIPKYIIGTSIKYSIHVEDSLGNTANARSGFKTAHITGSNNGITHNVYIGDSTSSSTISYVPYYYNYDYSWSRALYTSEDINNESDIIITDFAYYIASVSSHNIDKISFYMKETSDEKISANYIDPIKEGATLVWSGNITANSAKVWQNFSMTEPFRLSKGMNLIIYCLSHDGSYSGNGSISWTAESISNHAVYKYADGSFPTDDGTLPTTRPILRLTCASSGASPDSNAIALKSVLLKDTLITSNNSKIDIPLIITNNGIKTLNSAVINWTVNGVLQPTYNYSGAILDCDEDTTIIGSYTPRLNEYDTIVVWGNMPNGVVDTTTSDDTITIITYGVADIEIKWKTQPEDIVRFTGPHTISVQITSRSGNPIRSVNLKYSIIDTNGGYYDQDIIRTMNYDKLNNIYTTNIFNIPYYHNIVYEVSAIDFLNNKVVLTDTFSTIKITGDGISQATKTVGISDTTTIDVPYTASVGYGWSKSLYLHSDLGQAHNNYRIDNISYQYDTVTDVDSTINLSCYMQVVSYDSISDMSYIDPSTDTSLVLVWNGNISIPTTNTWIDIPLNTPFFVPAYKNLLVYWLNENGQIKTADTNITILDSTINYAYDTNIIVLDSTINYAYDTNIIVLDSTINYAYDTNLTILDSTINYTYDVNNVVIDSTVTYTYDTNYVLLDSTINYTYDTNLTILDSTINYTYDTNLTILDSTINYTYDTNYVLLDSTINYTYDTNYVLLDSTINYTYDTNIINIPHLINWKSCSSLLRSVTNSDNTAMPTTDGRSTYLPLTKFNMTQYTNINSVALKEIESLYLLMDAGSHPVECLIQNTANNILTSTNICWSVNNVSQRRFNWTGALQSDFVESVNIGNANLVEGYNIIKVWVESPNGVEDFNKSDDTVTMSILVCTSQPKSNYVIGNSSMADFNNIYDLIYQLSNCKLASGVTTIMFEDHTQYYNLESPIYLDEIAEMMTDNDTLIIGSLSGNRDNAILKFKYDGFVLDGNKNIYIKDLTLDIRTNVNRVAIGFLSRCNNIEINNCLILADTSNGTTDYPIYYSGTSSSAVGMGDIRILNNTINGGYTAIYLYYLHPNKSDIINNPGTVSIIGNTITDIKYSGIYTYYYAHIDFIKDNTIEFLERQNYQYGIYTYGYNRVDSGIINNKIFLNKPTYGYGINSYYMNDSTLGTTNPALIANNLIVLRKSFTTFYGAYIYYPTVNFYHNTIVQTDSVSGTAYGIYFYNYNGTPTDIRNNMIALYGTGTTYPFYSSSANYVLPTNNTILDYNNYYSRKGTVGYLGTAISSISNFRYRTTQDTSSLSIAPIWKDTNEYKIQNYAIFLAKNIGINTDVNGQERYATTPIGAHTDFPTGTDMGIVDFVFNTVNNSSNIKISVINAGLQAITSATINWEIDGVVQPAINWTGNISDWGMVDTISLGFTSTEGPHSITAWISSVNGSNQIDKDQSNDTAYSNSYICFSPIAGTFSVGGTNADFTDLQSVISVLRNCGINGPTTFMINPGTYDSLVIDFDMSFLGGSSTNTVTFTSATGNADDVIIKSDTLGTALKLDNVSFLRFNNITFDARRGNIGISLDSNINDIIFYGCNILLDTTSTTSTKYCVRREGTTSTTSTINNLQFIKNNIVGGYYSFRLYYMTGDSSLANNCSITIDSNIITKFYYYGIYAYYNANIKSISFNTITPRNSTSAQYVIYMNGSTVRPNIIESISGNKIRINNSSTCYGIYCYYCNLSTSTPALIANNEIIKNNNLAGGNYGIYNYYSDVNIYNNSILFRGTGSSYGIYNYLSSTYNNKISNIKGNMIVLLLPTATTTAYPMYVNSVAMCTTFLSLDYNNYYSNSNYVAYSGSARSTMAAHITATHQDSNSVRLYPTFIDTAINLDIVNYADFRCLNPGLQRDIRYRKRLPYTIMGAYSIETIDGMSVSLSSINGLPDTTKYCQPMYLPISCTITAIGADTIDLATNNLKLHLQISGSINIDTAISITQGTLVNASSLTIDIFDALNISGNEQFNLTAWLDNSWDAVKDDDTLSTSLSIKRLLLPTDENFTDGIPSSMMVLDTINSWYTASTNAAGTVTPQYGTQMLIFDGNTRGATSQLVTYPVNLQAAYEPILEFYFWHDMTAHIKDYVNVQVSFDEGTTYQTIYTLYKNNNQDQGWTHYRIPLDSFQKPCVMLGFYAMKWSPEGYDAEEYIDRIIISSKYDIGLTSIYTSNIDVCNLTGQSLNVVLSSMTAQGVDFTNSPTELKVDISGAKTASYSIPLTTGYIGNQNSRTFIIDNNMTFSPGEYYIKAVISPSVDENSSNDILYDTIIVNPELTITPTQITGGTSITNCLAVGAKVNQEVNITNSGNMDMDNLTLTLNIYNSSGVVVETINENLPYLLSSGEDTTYTFTSAYTVPDDESFNVEIIVHPTCNNSLTYNNSVVECIDVRNVVISQFIEPADDNTCSDVASRQKITVRVCNRTPNQDMRNISINAVVSAEGSQINAFKEVIDNLSINDSIDFTFSQSFIVPEANNYTIQVYIDKIDDTNDDDTLSITKCTNLGISESKVNTIGMSQNMPNPANNMAKVNYTIPSQGKVVFTITSITGQILHTQTIEAEAGANNIEFNTAHLADGIYFYTMDFNGQRLTKKMTIKK